MPETLTEAEQEFLAASVAVWRAIDRAMAEQPHYQGIEVMEEGVALRERERAAWDRYKVLLDGGREEARAMGVLDQARRAKRARDREIADRESACLRRSQELYARRLGAILEIEVSPTSWQLDAGARLSSMGGDIATPMWTTVEGIKVVGTHIYRSSSSTWWTTFTAKGQEFSSLAQFADAVDA